MTDDEKVELVSRCVRLLKIGGRYSAPFSGASTSMVVTTPAVRLRITRRSTYRDTETGDLAHPTIELRIVGQALLFYVVEDVPLEVDSNYGFYEKDFAALLSVLRALRDYMVLDDLAATAP